MKRLPLSVNKSNLLRLEEELSFARDGLELLDEKKEALMVHISTLSTKAERVRAMVNEALEESYGYLPRGDSDSWPPYLRTGLAWHFPGRSRKRASWESPFPKRG